MEEHGTRWDWVDAAPFRAHVRHLMETSGVPWRVLALYAQVPQPVVRALVTGHDRRPVRRIAPAYARALLAVTPAALRWSRSHRVRGEHTASLCRELMAAGWDVGQIATMIGLGCEQTRSLLENRLVTVPEMTEFSARAACLAHRLRDDDTDLFAAGAQADPDEPAAA